MSLTHLSRGFQGRTDALKAGAILAAICTFPLMGLGQTAAPVGASGAAPANQGPTMILTTPAAPASPSGGTATPAVPAPGATPAATPVASPTTPAASATPVAPQGSGTQEVAAVTQPFVATISSDRVYVRAGPGTAYYEMGQLGKGDLVYVVGSSRGWYQILPPNGTFCMIAKEFADVDASGTATVKGDYINIRAGTALNRTRDPSAVLTVVRKGTKLRVLGTTDKYLEVAPPEKAYVYISPQFVTQTQGVEYRVPQLKLPEGVSAPSVSTVTAPTSPPALASGSGAGAPGGGSGGGATLVIPLPGSGMAGPAPTGGSGATPIAAAPVTPTPAEGSGAATPVSPPVPKVTFSETAMARFKDANSRYQEEAKKPPVQQNVDSFLSEFKSILAIENISPSVKAGAEADVAAIERTLTVQKMVQEQATADAVTKQESEALRAQFDAAEKALAAAKREGPYSAEGVLQTSTIVSGKYSLVNPKTRRVVAYIDPASASVDVGSLIGKYIGVRGISTKMEGSDITLIQVSNATLMPEPK